MKLRRIDLPGFGCLTRFQAEFAPGLNVFFGENEAGKSTLQQAVCALLYGFFDNDRARPEESARHERFRPWSNGGPAPVYRGSLEFELSDGRSFEVRRDFSTTDVATQLIDLVTGADVSPEYGQGRHGNVPFARRLLGVPRSVFQSSAFIGQGEILEVSNGASPRDIGDAIAALADSSRRDISAKAAIDRLDVLIQKIGGDRARTAELPSAREALRLAQNELTALERAQQEVSQRAAELQAAQARLASIERDITRAQVLLLKARIASIERKFGDLAEADASLERGSSTMRELAAFAEFPAASRDTVLRLREGMTNDSKAAEVAVQDRNQRRSQVSDNDLLEYEGLGSSVGPLSAETLGSLRLAAYAAEPSEDQRAGLLRRLVAALLRAGRSLLRFLIKRPDPQRAEISPSVPTVSREEAAALLERHTRYLVLKPLVESLRESEGRLRTAEAALATTRDVLTGVLSAAGISPEPSLDGAVDEFLDGCRKHRLFQVAQTDAEEAVRRRRLLLGDRSSEELRAQLDDCARRLESLLRADPDLALLEPDSAAAGLSARLERLQADGRALEVTAARLEEEVRSSLRDHRPRAEIEEDAERWRREVARLEAAREAARLARDAIGEAMVAVYRDFAPAVNAFLSDGFSRITDGRYERAQVDPATLRVSLLVPETGQVLTDPPVSRGTLTAAYFLMRMGLAQHISNIGEPVPLVLDDPFVDMDIQRLQRMLDFILCVSERTQVLLFTKDPQVVEWFNHHFSGGEHRLHRLASAFLVTAAL